MPVILYTLLALAALVTVTNYFTDPAGIYRPAKSKQARNLRLRKLVLLKGLKRVPCATLSLGSSRVFNLALGNDARFPQPALNFAVTMAMAEDYLVCYKLVRGAQATAPKLVLIGIEHPAFHPTLPSKWESHTAGAYTWQLEAISAVRHGPAWRWRILLSPAQFHQSLIELQRRWRQRKGARQKFRWSADGSGTWIDLIEGKRNPRLLRRQLRNFPTTGLAIRSYTHPGEQRLRWFAELLAGCAAEGTQVIAYIVPAHPLLVQKTWDLGFKPMHDKLVQTLSEACHETGAVFRDWYDAEHLGFGEQSFRDAMHLTDEGQRMVADLLAREL